jgi:hypothetical protein
MRKGSTMIKTETETTKSNIMSVIIVIFLIVCMGERTSCTERSMTKRNSGSEVLKNATSRSPPLEAYCTHPFFSVRSSEKAGISGCIYGLDVSTLVAFHPFGSVASSPGSKKYALPPWTYCWG